VIDPSPWRVDPPCPFVAEGCGGCDLQHASLDGQRRSRCASCTTHGPHRAPPRTPRYSRRVLPGVAYRSTVRGVVLDGRFAFRRRASHDAIAIDSCLVAHPLLDELIRDATFAGAQEVTLRCGFTRASACRRSPRAKGIAVPEGVAVVGQRRTTRGGVSFFHEEVAGVRFASLPGRSSRPVPMARPRSSMS
jgi:23S rRNA (uracil1939-C5)-methyltransferase